MSAILAAENLVAGYRKQPVLKGVSLRLDPGEIVLLIGANGCGKTTLLKVLAGLLMPRAGQILLRGEDVSDTEASRRIGMGMGYLVQARNTFPSLTVLENLRLSFWRQHGDFDQRRDRILSLFPMLERALDRRAGLLSGGESQALAIAMVLMRPVDVLLLDEPSAGLPPSVATAILTGLGEAQANGNFAAIIVEHNVSLVRHWASRVLLMAEGRITMEAHGTEVLADIEDLYNPPFA